MKFTLTQKDLSTIHRMLGTIEGASFNSPQTAEVIVTAVQTIDEILEKADVVEVKHGEWIEDGYYDNPCVCSICGEEAPYTPLVNEIFEYDWEENLQPMGYEVIREYIRTPYCPNCGAKMKERERE